MDRDSWKIVEKHLGSLEAEIMKVIWRSCGLPVREVVEAIPGRRRRAYTTIMTVMNRLYEKNLLSRTPKGRAFVYFATMSESDFLADLAKKTIRGVLSEYGDVALAHFVGEVRDLGPEEVERLREMLSKEEK